MKKSNQSKFLIINFRGKKIKIIHKNSQVFNHKSSKIMKKSICKFLKIKVLILYKKNYLIKSKVLMKSTYKMILIKIIN